MAAGRWSGADEAAAAGQRRGKAGRAGAGRGQSTRGGAGDSRHASTAPAQRQHSASTAPAQRTLSAIHLDVSLAVRCGHLCQSQQHVSAASALPVLQAQAALCDRPAPLHRTCTSWISGQRRPRLGAPHVALHPRRPRLVAAQGRRVGWSGAAARLRRRAVALQSPIPSTHLTAIRLPLEPFWMRSLVGPNRLQLTKRVVLSRDACEAAAGSERGTALGRRRCATRATQTASSSPA